MNRWAIIIRPPSGLRISLGKARTYDLWDLYGTYGTYGPMNFAQKPSLKDHFLCRLGRLSWPLSTFCAEYAARVSALSPSMREVAANG